MKSFLLKVLIAILLLAAAEMGLRTVGFGKVPLYYESEVFEYALQPSQDIKRFGNHFFINEEGMRCNPLRKNTFRIIKFGDSVLNGGILTDQESLASEILEDSLKRYLPGAEVLNISAGSWEPDNAFAWMKDKGDFDAKIIVLVFSSHDWKEQMTFKRYVDQVPFYPSEQPVSALTDALSWIYSRTFLKVDWNSLPLMEGAKPRNSKHNLGWDSFVDYHRATRKPLLVYHHASLLELQLGEWNMEGIELQQFLDSLNIPAVSGLDAGFSEADYRDAIHPNESGQNKIAQALLPHLQHLIQSNEAF